MTHIIEIQIMENKNIKMLACIFALVAIITSCQSPTHPTEVAINSLQKQLKNDFMRLEQLETNDLPGIQHSYLLCDSLLQYAPKERINEYFDILNLTNAYLIQFKDNCPQMHEKFEYSAKQLESLKSDLSTEFISDSLASIYLSDERNAADTLHEQILYFEERLQAQKEILRKLMKDFNL